MVHLDYRDVRPIYTQIVDGYREQIAAGVLRSGEKLPSVRELAIQLSINPNTIQRSYRQLEAEGWIATVPGKGCFVCGLPEYTLEQRQELLSCGGYVGKNGAVDEKREGDKSTPRGLYSIEQAFYFAEAPVTGLPTFQITKDTYWVDDPESKYYNKRVEGTENQDWTSAEHMYRYSKSYEYGFVVGYNVEAVPYAGSAIFFHVSDHPTAGCIATDREFVLQYLAVLDETKNPYILIN